jgi:pimeloyl-ACP methyl ester carboxylesterase
VSGTAWSDPGPKLTCAARVNEVYKLIRAAKLGRPLVLVGLSIGGCVARLYAAQHAADVAGMVIVDHAFQPDPPPPSDDAPPTEPGVTRPVLIYQAPIALTVEDISNFKQLPERAQELHRWAMSLKPKLPDWDDAEDCLKQLKGAPALGRKPLVVVRTDNQARGYDRSQNELLALSTQSSQLYANRSFHAVEIDRPEVVVAAIRRVVDAIHIAAPR